MGIVLLLVLRVIVILTFAWSSDYSKYLLYTRQVRDTTVRIPTILHHTWKDDNIPDDWSYVVKHCYDMHPKYKRMLWTNEKSREFIASEFPWFLSTYDSYWYDIQRADVIRYFVLYKYGGIYLDLDVGCREKLDFFLPYTFILPETSPVGFSNDVIMSVPHHQFLAFLIDNLQSWNYIYGSKYLTVFFSTGPAFVSYHMNQYLSQLRDIRKHNDTDVIAVENSTTLSRSVLRRRIHFTDDVSILDRELYNNNKEYSFFYHVRGNSWHGWDVKAINLVVKYWYFLLILIVVLIVMKYRRLSQK